jgi:predicted transglutaminase-like cysteine proteinase
MPRLPDRLVSRMQPTSTLGSRLSKTELTDASVTEARAVAKQAIDAVSSGEALSALATRLQGESISAPLSSMRDLTAGRRWLDGVIKLDARSAPEDVKVLQRALMKIGAHHPQGRGDAALMLLPWGADGSLGQSTLRAVDSALRLAGRANLTPASSRLPLNREIAQVIEGLLRSTPAITMPRQQDVFPTTPTTTSPQRLNLMGRTALPIGTSNYTERWNGVLARTAAEQPRYRVGAPGLSANATRWLQQLEATRGQPQSAQLAAVNRIVNENRYRSDLADTWSTPLEFFERQGDCEDFVIAKMVSLEKLGFESSRMRMLIVKDTISGQAHAVLAVDMPDATYILDNQSQLVLKHDEIKVGGRHVYEPLFGLARDKQWLYGIAR